MYKSGTVIVLILLFVFVSCKENRRSLTVNSNVSTINADKGITNEHDKIYANWFEAQKQMDLHNYSEAIIYLKKAIAQEPRIPTYNHVLTAIARTYALTNEIDSTFQYLELYADALNQEKIKMESSTGMYRRAYSKPPPIVKTRFCIFKVDFI